MNDISNEHFLNKVLHGDSLELLKEIKDQSIDLCVTDPPYGINFHSNHRKKSVLKSTNGILNDDKDNNLFLSQIIDEIDRVMKDDSHIYWFTRWDRVKEQQPLLEKHFKVKNALVWMKNNWSMGDLKGAYAGQYETILFCQKGRRTLNEIDGTKRHSDILQFDRVPPNKLNHSHEKPTELIDFLIKKSSFVDDVVIDCFLGSGTTAVSAVNTKRNFIGIEKDWDYCLIANERIKEAQEIKIS